MCISIFVCIFCIFCVIIFKIKVLFFFLDIDKGNIYVGNVYVFFMFLYRYMLNVIDINYIRYNKCWWFFVSSFFDY